MENIEGYPAITITYGKSGESLDSQHTLKLRTFVKAAALDDLIVISHGWNNSKSEAFNLYRKLLKNFKAQQAGNAQLANRKIGVLAIVWPSKRFKAFEKDDFAGGAAATSEPEISDPLADAEALIAELDNDLSDEEQADLLDAAQKAIDDENNWPAFLETLRRVLPFDPEGGEEADALLFSGATSPLQALAQFSTINVGGANNTFTGGAAGFGLPGAAGAVGSVLNFSTFYAMKKRAGEVGQHGIARSVVGLRKAMPNLRIHFVGHSFGARAVSAAALALNGHPLSAPDSMVLLQAAFSHNSFSARFPPSQKAGLFRRTMTKACVKGPILVTHTFNDTPNRVAYSIASALSGQNASFTNEPSQFGALGANGAQHMNAEASQGNLLASGASGYSFGPGKIYNLEASAFISGHSDVKGPEVAYALTKAMTATI